MRSDRAVASRAKRHVKMRYRYQDGEPVAPSHAEDQHLLDSYPDESIAHDAATMWRLLIIDLKLVSVFGVSVEKMPHVRGWYGVYATRQQTAEQFDLGEWLSEHVSTSKLRLRLVSRGSHKAT